MKKIFYLTLAALLLVAATPRKTPADANIKGAWKLLRAQYGESAMKDQSPDDFAYKLITDTRWSSAYYNLKEKTFEGAGGGTYTLKGDQYTETIEYFSWEPEATGKKFNFTLKIEKGLLHQVGTIEYKGNPKYVIDEWYERVD
jgi:hypothetical protein